jgi:hypothetical protein
LAAGSGLADVAGLTALTGGLAAVWVALPAWFAGAAGLAEAWAAGLEEGFGLVDIVRLVS